MTKKKKKSTEKPNHFFAAQASPTAGDRYLDLAKSKDNWRNMSFLLAGLMFFILGAYLYKSQQSDIKPYVYHYDETGRLLAMGVSEPENIHNNEQVEAHIYKIIDHLRTVYGHDKIMEDRLRNVFEWFLTPQVSTQLNNYYSVRENDPRIIAERYSRSISIQGIVATESTGKDWKVQWVETTVSKNDVPVKRQAWEAYLTIDFEPLTEKQQALLNPLGIIITDLSWGAISQ